MNAAANRDSTAASGPENHTKDHILARRRAIRSLGDRETIRIIRDAHSTAKRDNQISIEWTAIQPG
jgi:hypothetical protein